METDYWLNVLKSRIAELKKVGVRVIHDNGIIKETNHTMENLYNKILIVYNWDTYNSIERAVTDLEIAYLKSPIVEDLKEFFDSTKTSPTLLEGR